PTSVFCCAGASRVFRRCRVGCRWSGDGTALRSFPTRRSSDLESSWWSCPLGASQGRHGPWAAGGSGVDLLERVEDYIARHRLLRSEEHTSELQSRENLVCRLLLEKKKSSPSHNGSNRKRILQN